MHKLLLVIMIAILTTGSICNASKPTTPTASEILQRTAKTYATCISYRDTGTVAITSEYLKNPTNFKTVFTRPDQFRFEYNRAKDKFTESVRHIVWTSGNTAYWWWTVDNKITQDSLRMAIAGATGVSSCSVHTIPILLMPDKITGWKLTDIKNPKRLPSEAVQGTDCFKIEGNDIRGNKVTLWITKSNHLIRKIIHRFKRGNMAFTTIYKPELNVIIPESDFESGVDSQPPSSKQNP